MSDQTDAPQNDAPAEQAPEPNIVDQLGSRFDALEGTIGELQQSWQSQQQPQEDMYEPQAIDPYGYDQQQQGQVDQYGNPVEQQGMDQRQIQSMVEQGINKGLEPIQQYMLGQQLSQLTEKYPEMQDPKVIQQLDQTTGMLAQQFGNPALATDPRIVEMAFKAYRADQLASQQTPAGNQSDVQLEQSGATPPAQEQDPGDQMFGPRRNAPSGPFGGWAVR